MSLAPRAAPLAILLGLAALPLASAIPMVPVPSPERIPEPDAVLAEVADAAASAQENATVNATMGTAENVSARLEGNASVLLAEVEEEGLAQVDAVVTTGDILAPDARLREKATQVYAAWSAAKEQLPATTPAASRWWFAFFGALRG